jgi:hypothetical protein
MSLQIAYYVYVADAGAHPLCVYIHEVRSTEYGIRYEVGTIGYAGYPNRARFAILSC